MKAWTNFSADSNILRDSVLGEMMDSPIIRVALLVFCSCAFVPMNINSVFESLIMSLSLIIQLRMSQMHVSIAAMAATWSELALISSDYFESLLIPQKRLNRPTVNAVQWRHSLTRVVILIGWLSKHLHNYVFYVIFAGLSLDIQRIASLAFFRVVQTFRWA